MLRIRVALVLGLLLLPIGAVPAAALSPDQPAAPVELSAAQVALIFVGIPLLVIGLVWALVSLPGAQGGEAAGLAGPLNEGPFWVNPPTADEAGSTAAPETGALVQGGAGARW